MSNIVERLRLEAKWARGEDGGIPDYVRLTAEEAADEIERLRAELAARAAPCHIDGCQYDEIDRLRKWLQVIADHPVEGSGMWEVGAREMLRCARSALAGEEKTP